LVSEAIDLVTKIKTKILEGANPERFIRGAGPLTSIREIFRVSKLCFEALCIITRYLQMKVECKVFPDGYSSFEDLRHWFNKLSNEVHLLNHI